MTQTNNIISTRIRFARNIDKVPFAPIMTEAQAKDLIERTNTILSTCNCTFVDFSSLSNVEKESYIENHMASPEFSNNPMPHALFIEKNTNLSIMVNEEDHFRIQSICKGFDLKQAYQNASLIEKRIDEEFHFAKNNELGYLTHCPSNLGTAMRASVIVFLPALTKKRYISSLSDKLNNYGFTIRGFYGEGSEALGCLYQISNKETLGITEQQTLLKLENTISFVLDAEDKAKQSIQKEDLDTLSDEIMRSYGIASYCKMLSTKEFFNLYANIRMGIDIGLIISNIEELDKLLIECSPATLTLKYHKEINSICDRDKIRAKIVNNFIRKE